MGKKIGLSMYPRNFWKFHVVVVQNNGKEMYKKRVPCKVDFLFRNCIADIKEKCSVSPRVFLIEK